MMKLSFPTVKLGKYIKEVKCKVKNTDLKQSELIVYGVTNTDGIAVTNNKVSDDLGNYTVLSENQFAYNPYRINVGSIGLSDAGVFGVVSPAYVVFQTNPEISSEFLLYYLKSTLGINLIKWYGDRGGVRSALRFSDLEKIDFPDINLNQQLKILKKVKQIDGKLFELHNNLSLENISLLRQSILQQAVEGKLCEQNPSDEPASVLLQKIKVEKEKLIVEKKIKKQKELSPITEEEKPFDLPHGWEWCRLGDISNYITDGKHGDCTDQENSGYFFISAKDIVNGRIIYRDTRQIAKSDFIEVHQRTNLEPNDILVPNTGASIGKIAITQENEKTRKTTFQKSVAIIKYNDSQMYPTYLYNAILIEVNKIQKTLKGTAMVNLLLSEIRNFIIPLPPLAEQQRIIEKVDRFVVLCDELEQEIANARKLSSQLMEAVLQEYFSNKKESGANNVIVFTPAQKSAPESLLAAARGNMREDTWENLRTRALELASEGS